MKRLTIICLVLSMSISCKPEKEKDTSLTDSTPEMPPLTDEVLENAVIYEANIRQYSEEGSFNAFTKDIPSLKNLGVKIIWVMPIYPISSTKSKGSLGSYYAITDYAKVNPEFGTLEDFRALVKTAHENGMYVILDWVANHTGWDHVWIHEKPEYYTKDSDGNITDPINQETGESWGWTDVADLNYDNADMQQEMISLMKYWVKEEHVDGFRCDVAGAVPVSFWEKATAELRKEKPVFMLAEAWEPSLMQNAFDMAYGWETHHVMNRIAQGKNTVANWDHRMKEIDSMYQPDDILMNFTSNHDENSWQGTVFERMGDAAETFAALSFCAPGMPLIYSGQEYDLNKRLLFFEKDTIRKQRGKFYPVYEKLGALKNINEALNGGKHAGSYKRIATSDDQSILAFEREKNGNSVIFVANLTNAPINFTMPLNGSFEDYMSGDRLSFSESETHAFEPWQYRILLPIK